MLSAKLQSLYSYIPPTSSIDHLIIGGGVLGLSIANALSTGPGSTIVVDRRTDRIARNQTSSRKPRRIEVIESGIYYPLESLSSRLCIRGRQLLYDRCERLKIPYRKTEKLIIATQNEQVPYLDHLQTLTTHPSLSDPSIPSSPYISSSTIPTYFLSPTEARALEPDLSEGLVGALLDRESGIVDYDAFSQTLVEELEGKVGDGSAVVGCSRVLRVDVDREEEGKEDGWIVQLESGSVGGSSRGDGGKGVVESIRAKVVINTLGPLGVGFMAGDHNESGVEKLTRRMKKSYLSYNGPGVNQVTRLMHLAPLGQPPSQSSEINHISARLKIDLDGNLQFGPLIHPTDHNPTQSQIEETAHLIQAYLPSIDPGHLKLIEPDSESEDEDEAEAELQDEIDLSDSTQGEASKGGGEIKIISKSSEGGGGKYIDVYGGAGGVTSALGIAEEVSRIVRSNLMDDGFVAEVGAINKIERKGGKGWLRRMSEGWDR